MALRQKLSRPLVVDPAEGHSHTVVFLHRFPEPTTDHELHDKVLSEKLTRNHKTLREQFPTVRWVFPFCKAHARPWNNLSPDDRVAVGMTLGNLPYVTQVILQEAERAQGLDKIILGGQGETAEAAHEAMSSFPETKISSYDNEDEMAAFIRKHFHQDYTDLEQLKLAGFVGMHVQDGQLTRDVKNFGMMSKEIPAKQKINSTIIKNTPHKFIHGGYKLQTMTWDGKRIDDFASFLVSIGVQRFTDMDQEQVGNETLTPRDRPDPAAGKGNRVDAKDELNDMQKHALEVAEQKKANDALKEKVLHRIEADKVERKIRQERARQKRLYGGATARPTGSTNLLGASTAQVMPGSYPLESPEFPDANTPYSDSPTGEDEMIDEFLTEPSSNRNMKSEQGKVVGGGSEWDSQSQTRGEMSDARMAALGLTRIKSEDDA
ncbi:phospholipase carboxylesterase [Diaporthe amygdali]|uniref:phospholipase carboxylesterase n=1 Tax=Phomopsis amygdali TaxID=1214568 RepID=UPI0022FEA937|nr:phospholipase carboxylesterase [Diaporthe amygdali]KAJ0123924.1 phospholipase carboxylesterase [Diaporthe amygdali]